MGCICSKGIPANEYVAESHSKERHLKSNRSSRHGASLRKEESVLHSDGGQSDAMARLILNQPGEENAGSTPESDDAENATTIGKAASAKPLRQERPSMEDGDKRVGVHNNNATPRIIGVVIGEKGALVIAGWPSWLTSVAGEAINGWVPRKADSFQKLDKIGQGTYSSVYRARDMETNKIVALKKVRFANMDPESVRFMAREILILRRLDHPNVMKLEGLITSRVSGSLYLIFEYMEHDLAGLVATPGIKFTEAQIKCYMKQLLCGLEHCHVQGVLHRDIKGSNLLIDNNGNLKIGDFGLSTFFRSRQKQPLTSRVVTLWYRPPELLLGATDYGVSVDLWSAGCILAELYAGKPIMPGRTEVEQLHKIFKLCGSPSEEYWKRSKLPHATIFKPQHPYKRCVAETFKDFPFSALALLDVLLAVEPDGRGTASSALQSEFFTTKPLPSDPSALPKYPPCKEFDVKLRDEESRRRRAPISVAREHAARKFPRESKAIPAPDANAELQASIQKKQGQQNPTSVSEKYNHEEDGGSGFCIEPSKEATQMQPTALGSSRNTNGNQGDNLGGSSVGAKGAELRKQRSFMQHGSGQLSRYSNSVAVRGGSRFGCGGESSVNSHWPEECFNVSYNHFNGSESSEKHEWSHHLLDRPKSSYKIDNQSSGKESTMVKYPVSYAPKKRIHYSGPLMPPGGNLDEMLKEHEKQIQYAVRKARIDKAKTKKTYNDKGQMESLLHHVRNGN
ncbi:probable serine/threonine-protein kinase At1g09600 isoform X1 [Benincasa hispida]|uniref:probable serine/threonine-protein kinase At1g09600 isoform X1 n=1 Tax=Benincasa hispida TaxID=102211 RepID=UPI0018FFD02C|nr:probable serine/threonine-protein kinase At1g09600 isoform X1 [Benincasa hispida]